MSEFFITTGITLVSLTYLILVQIMFILKKKTNRVASRYFFFLTFLASTSLIIYIIQGYFAVNGNISVANILGRIQIFITLEWILLLIHYFSVAFQTDEANRKHISKNIKPIIISVSIVTIANILLCIFLPFEFVSSGPGNPYLPSGLLDSYYKLWGIVILICAIIFLAINKKTTSKHSIVIISVFFGMYIVAYLLVYLLKIEISNIPFLMSAIEVVLYLSVESQDASLLSEFNESNLKAEESNKLKSEFIMNMSHQLRTPMNTILGFSDSLLTNENLTLESVNDDSGYIKQASKRLLELVNSILDISKLQSGKEILNDDDYLLDTVIYDVSSHINSLINKENLLFNINANENCPNNLYGDAYKLAKVLNIFLDNAVKYTNYGEVSLNVSSSLIENDIHEFVFHIKNTGHAMKTENFERSFEDLIKLNSSASNDIDADTLKIIVAKGLLNIIGGSVDFINEVGQGTQYIIKLKQKVTSNAEIGNIKEKIQTRHEITHEIINLLGKKCLVVDDEKVNIVILERLLQQYNISFESTFNPRDGVDKATNNQYDIIFVGHNMEDMSGEEFITKLEATGNKIPPVVGLISTVDDCDKEYKYSSLLVSPIEFRELNKVIKKYFSNEI